MTTINRGDAVKVKGIAGVGKVLDMWTPAGAATLVKVGFYRPKSGKLVSIRVEGIENVSRA